MWCGCAACVCGRFVAFIFTMSKVFCSCWALDLFFIRYCNSRERLLLTFRVLVYGWPTTPCHNMPNISIVFAHLKWQDINTHVCCAELSVHRIVWNWMWCAVMWCDHALYLYLVPLCTNCGAAHYTCKLYGQHQVVDGGRKHNCEVIFATDSIKMNLSPSKHTEHAHKLKCSHTQKKIVSSLVLRRMKF